MKNLIKLLSLMTVTGLILASCEGPMGPAGADGKDGTNGVNGADGKDVKEVCLVCHSGANQEAILAQYHLSKHFTGTTSARNGKYCAKCHTNEGVQEVLDNGKFIVSNDMPNATRINCETCHKHTAFDFQVDTIAEILRTTAPVYLNYDKNLVATDFGSINNLCTTCHQIRGPGNIYTTLPFFPLDYTKLPTDNVEYRLGQSFSVHDGNQSNLFAGINGYEYAGQTYTRTWTHSDNSCTDCHMNEYNATTKTGGHTLIVNEDACNDCHGSDTKVTIVQSAIDAKLLELGNLLVARKVFKSNYSAVNTHDYNGLLFDGTTTTEFVKIEANNTVSTTTGLVVYGSKLTPFYDTSADAATRINRPWKYGELGAAYNYGYIKSELSRGAHNPTYALQLLQKSIDWLNTN